MAQHGSWNRSAPLGYRVAVVRVQDGTSSGQEVFAGGFFVGLRWSDAPILHGVAMTFVSVLVWFVWLLLTPGTDAEWFFGRDPVSIFGAILLQAAAAIAGGVAGRATVRRGHVPDPAMLPPEG